MQEIDVAIGKFRDAKFWKNTSMSWDDLAKRCSETIRTHERYNEYIKAPKARQDEIKDVGAFVGGFLANSRRTKTSVIHRQVIALDADFAEPDLWDDYCAIFGAAAFCYSTHKHRPDAPRLRICILADRPLMPDEYEPVGRYITSLLDINQFDHTTYDVNRLMYWPSTAADGEFVYERCDGAPLDVDRILLSYTNWRDATEWPIGELEKRAIKSGIDKQGEPTEKPGAVGLWCRTYSITDILDNILTDVYEACDVEGRYTYRDGTTAGGLVVYDDKFAYSHHSSDPVSEKLVNAFDLYRLHKFGHLDATAKEDTPINRLPSYTAMVAHAQSDENVKRVNMSERLADIKNDFGDFIFTEADLEWMQGLETDNKGAVKPTYENIGCIIRNDPALRRRFRLNEFTGTIEVIHPTPWNPRHGTEPLTDNDERGLRAYIGSAPYSLKTPTLISDIFPLVAAENGYHPVKDYLESLSWDGVQRVETMLTDYLGAEDTEINRVFIRKVLCAAVKRIYHPGVKFDYVLTLVGGEGVRKSTFARSLGMDWFSDTFNFAMLTSGNGVRHYEQLRGQWIVEIPEMAGMRKTEIEMAKSFIASPEDTYRVSHGKNPTTFKRQCIFIGTTNNFYFLMGQTGNRRFWPVDVRKVEPKYPIEGEVIDKHTIGQIWAEVMTMYEDEQLKLSDEMEAEAKKLQLEHTEVDDREGLILRFLEMKLPADWQEMEANQRAAYFAYGDATNPGLWPRDRVCAAEIWVEALGGGKRDLSAQNSRFIHNVMRNLSGEWAPSKAGLRFPIYGIQRGYIRINQVNKTR